LVSFVFVGQLDLDRRVTTSAGVSNGAGASVL
jgi:hypothetical protein